MNEKEFNGLILAELVKIANEVFTNEIEIAPGTYTAAELAKLKDANGNEINIKYLCVDAKLNITDFRAVQINSFKCSFPVDQVFNLVWQFEKLIRSRQSSDHPGKRTGKRTGKTFTGLICGCTNENTGVCLCFGSSDRFYFPLVLSGSNKQSITEANNVNRTIRHFFA